uniref:Uncharacterized protein n=1 Tax=Anguilla anguilla TaxID=7936 RepID=A0A0E9WKG8_ANGAN
MWAISEGVVVASLRQPYNTAHSNIRDKSSAHALTDR